LFDGAGGIGKTWLAMRAGHLATHFQRKIFLSAKVRHLTTQGEEKLEDFMLPNFVALITELARELDEAGIARLPENDRVGEVKRALNGQATLIIVDNLETFEKIEQNRLYQFLNRLPENCKAIVTSRRRTDIDTRIIRLDRLDADSALKLLEIIAQNNKALARTTTVERQTLYEITQGNPLLLRWTAGQIGRGHCRSVEKACEFLKNAPKENDPLEYIFGDLLDTFTESEKAVLAALSLFTQPAEIKWISDISGLAEMQANTALDDLSDRSLLISDETQEKFILPRLAAIFLKRKCPEIVAQAEARLTDKVYALVLENGGYDNYEKFPILETEWSNISAALPLFLAGDNKLLQSLCTALYQFLDFSGRWDEWLELSQRAESKAEVVEDFYNAGVRAFQTGWLHHLRGQANKVLECADRAEHHWKQSNAGARERAFAIRLRGIGYTLQKDWQAAINTLEETLKIFRTLSSESEDVAITLNSLSSAQKESGDYISAERNCREALQIANKINDIEGIAVCTANLAELMLIQKKWLEVEQLAKEALDLSEKIGRQELIGRDCWVLAHSLAKQNRAKEGLPYAQRAVEIFTRLRINPETLKEAQETLTLCESLCN
jgi:tetratricopeptide (TPR) repeat protein